MLMARRRARSGRSHAPVEAGDRNGAEGILRALAGMGVRRIFASPGSEWAALWEALAKARALGQDVPRYLSTRHEEVALGMASGYAKATGELPAVVIHTTVGALHGAMAMRGALHEQIPMIILTGETVTFGEDESFEVGDRWLRHLADLGGPARLVERCVKWSFGVNSPAIPRGHGAPSLPAGARLAARTRLPVRAHRVPVHFDRRPSLHGPS
jgi:thiamine pyrophosphate-dependent acetolactate synthase large subunit-like protein